jgi:LPXTG-motif cell wall-anchored protein
MSSLSTAARRTLAASAFCSVLFAGAGTASAQDEHSGGVSPNTETRDPGTAVAGNTVTREAGAAGNASSGLPVTGSDIAGMTLLGSVAVAGGAGAVAISRRRARSA